MKYVEDLSGADSHIIETGVTCLEGNPMDIEFCNGYGQMDINLFGYYITWDQLDKIEKAVEVARDRWMKF